MRENILCFLHIHTLYIYATSSAYSSSSRRTFRRSVTEFRHHRENFIWPGRASRGHNERCLLNPRTHACKRRRTIQNNAAAARLRTESAHRIPTDTIRFYPGVRCCWTVLHADSGCRFVRQGASHASRGCGLLLRTSHVPWSVCSGLRKLCKTAEQFGRQSCVGPKDHY